MNQGAVSNTPNSQAVPLILSQHSKRLNRVHSRGDAIQNGIDDGGQWGNKIKAPAAPGFAVHDQQTNAYLSELKIPASNTQS